MSWQDSSSWYFVCCCWPRPSRPKRKRATGMIVLINAAESVNAAFVAAILSAMHFPDATMKPRNAWMKNAEAVGTKYQVAWQQTVCLQWKSASEKCASNTNALQASLTSQSSQGGAVYGCYWSFEPALRAPVK